MDRREFLNFLGKGIAIGSISPLMLKGRTIISIDLKKIQGIPPSNSDDVVLAESLKYNILISWKDKINKSEKFGFNNDYVGFIPGKRMSEGFLWINHEYMDPLFFSGKSHDQKSIEAKSN